MSFTVGVTRSPTEVVIRQRSKSPLDTLSPAFSLSPSSNVTDMRNKFKEEFLKKHGVKLGFMSAFVRASCFALQDQPVVNAGGYTIPPCPCRGV